ncbi:lipase 2 [Mycobacteroides abscessus]|nr:lipase 2 [Mycobacteroides abscessus]
MAGRYVALGSSMAAGPGIMPRAQGSPRLAGRSARNYPHQIAERQGYRLVDVTYSGATTAHILTDSHNNDPPQIDALDGTEELVTVTVGGNDVGYVPFLAAASLPRILHALPVVGRALDALLDPNKREEACAGIGKSLRAVGEQVRDRAPRARVIFVDYLSLLPPEGQPAPPYTLRQSTTGHRIAGHWPRPPRRPRRPLVAKSFTRPRLARIITRGRRGPGRRGPPSPGPGVRRRCTPTRTA